MRFEGDIEKYLAAVEELSTRYSMEHAIMVYRASKPLGPEFVAIVKALGNLPDGSEMTLSHLKSQARAFAITHLGKLSGPTEAARSYREEPQRP